MYDTGTLALVALGCFTLGCLLGAWALHRFAPQRQERKGLEDHIHQLQQQQQDYQEQVNEHFNETAKLLNQLAGSYREVHNHLVHSARELTSHGVSPLQPLPEGKPVLEGDTEPRIVEPPLDYVPHTPGRKGALREDFGLEDDFKKDKEKEKPRKQHSAGENPPVHG